MAQQRTRYTRWQKEQVALHYGGCRNVQDRLELARRAGIVNPDGEPSIERLYNLANRLGVTGRAEPLAQAPTLQAGQGKSEFTPEFDAYLKQEFGRRRLDSIAFHHGYSEPAALYRARKLKLRRFCPYWDVEKAAPWLGLDADGLAERVPVWRLPDRAGRPAVTLVASADLAALPEAELAAADPFFSLELAELKLELGKGKKLGPTWLSHERTCLNPYAMGFGLFMDEEDEKTPVLALTVEDLAEIGAERWQSEAPRGALA